MGGEVDGFVGGNDFKSKMGNSRKSSNRCLVEGGHIYFFWKKTPWIFRFVTLWIFRLKKKSFTCGNCATFSDTPCLRNSITKSQDPWIREIVKKGKFVTKIFFSDNVEWSSKNLWKMIFADVKANKNNTKIKDLVVASYKFL